MLRPRIDANTVAKSTQCRFSLAQAKAAHRMIDCQPPLAFLESGDCRLAYRLRPGTAPALVFLPGYASDMDGAKALALDAFAERRELAMLRFDYSGTGSSSGAFEDGALNRWLDEALAVIDRLIDGPVVLIGSSMGGWIALHVALRRTDRVAALVGIAAAPDFTDWGFSAEHKAVIARDGAIGPESHRIHRAFWQSGEALRLLEGEIAIDCPVRLIHGEEDGDVPVAVAMRLMHRLRSGDVQLQILKGGGHRLSEPHEIEAILRTVAALLEPAP
jgi:pimeloyl-ACP methyl ester carboxylesterase